MSSTNKSHTILVLVAKAQWINLSFESTLTRIRSVCIVQVFLLLDIEQVFVH